MLQMMQGVNTASVKLWRRAVRVWFSCTGDPTHVSSGLP
jgi:hypothetical protein